MNSPQLSVALLVSTLLGGGLLLASGRIVRSRGQGLGSKVLALSSGGGRRLPMEILTILGVISVGLFYAQRLHHQVNPFWLPLGQDWIEFLSYGLRLHGVGDCAFVPNRYPFYPFLGERVATWQDMPIYIGLMQVSIVSVGLLPFSLYLFGRQLAPRPVAVVGAFVPMQLPALLELLGPPTEYLFITLWHVLAMAAGLSALRKGGRLRFGLFGVSLALLMISTPRALLILTVGIPLAVIGLGVHFRKHLWRGAQAAVLLTTPLIASWLLYAHLGLEVHSLERLVINAQQGAVEHLGYELTELPTGAGWSSTDPRHHGYWRVGHFEALSHLPETYRFFLEGVETSVPPEVRQQTLTQGMKLQLPHLSPLFLLWAVLGAMGSIAHRVRNEGALQQVLSGGLATTYVLAGVGSLAASFVSSVFIPRYSVLVLVFVPVLVLAGLTLTFRAFSSRWMMNWPWWPLAGVVLTWMAYGIAPTGGDMLKRQSVEIRSLREGGFFQGLWYVMHLPQRAAVVDLTEICVVADLFPGSSVRPRQTRGVTQELEIPPSESDRRFIIQACQFSQGNPSPTWMAEEGRLQKVSDCVDEDRRPTQLLHLSRAQ